MAGGTPLRTATSQSWLKFAQAAALVAAKPSQLLAGDAARVVEMLSATADRLADVRSGGEDVANEENITEAVLLGLGRAATRLSVG